MNFKDMQEEVWKNIGLPDTTTGTRTDARRQTIRDALNQAMADIAATCSPKLDFLIRETTLSVVAGTQDYLIDDRCQRPLSLWTEGQYAHRIDFRKALAADRDGSRNSLYVVGDLGPFQCALLPRTSAATLSNIAAANKGALVVEGAKTCVIGSDNAVLDSSSVGRMLVLNGEDADYLITGVSSRTITVDKPILARLTGNGVTGTGGGYAEASTSWEIGPAGRFKVRFLPIPTASATVYVRYMAYPRWLVGDSDRPELQKDMHQLIVKGAMKSVASGKQNSESFQLYQVEFERLLTGLKASDVDDYSSDDGPQVETLDTMAGSRPVRQPGEYRRGGW